MGVGTFQFKAPDDATSVKVYVVGDLHIGSPDCSMRQVRRVLNAITLDDAAYVAYIGDLITGGGEGYDDDTNFNTLRCAGHIGGFYSVCCPAIT